MALVGYHMYFTLEYKKTYQINLHFNFSSQNLSLVKIVLSEWWKVTYDIT